MMTNSKCALIAAILGISVSHSSLACEDIAVVSRDARYLVLSGDTLEVKDVGSLWWLGIRGVDQVAAGSTLERAAIFSDDRVDTSTGAPNSRESALMVIRELGRSMQSPEDLGATEDSELTKAWWVDDSSVSRLIGVRRTDEKQTIILLDGDLNKQAEWDAKPPTLGLGVACKAAERIIVGGIRDRLITAKGAVMATEPLRRPPGASDYRLLGVAPFGCTGLMAENVTDANKVDLNSDQLTVRTIDLATNQLGPKFQAKRAAESVLFAGGAKLLQQELIATPVESGGYSLASTGRVRTLDTRNGLNLKSAELPVGAISRLVCRGENEKVLIASPKKIHLIDIATLSVVASRPIPFETYFAF